MFTDFIHNQLFQLCRTLRSVRGRREIRDFCASFFVSLFNHLNEACVGCSFKVHQWWPKTQETSDREKELLIGEENEIISGEELL